MDGTPISPDTAKSEVIVGRADGAAGGSVLGCDNCVTVNVLRSQVGYWRAMHRNAKAREAALVREVEDLTAKLRLRERQLFGRKSESESSDHSGKGASTGKDKPGKRGQQRGNKGHGRRLHEDLPTRDVNCELGEDDCKCPNCGLPFEKLDKGLGRK